MRVLAALALMTVAGGAVRGQESPIPAMGNRDLAFVAATPSFRFHSDFWLNLHDYLYAIAGGGPDPRAGYEPENPACFAALEGDPATGWREAEAWYREGVGERHHRRDPLIRSIRYGLAGLAQRHDSSVELDTVLALLRGAAPAYRTCLWAHHDARNRAVIGELVTRTVRYGAALQHELSEAYRAPFPERVVVDVVSYSDYAGANTASGVSDPGHMMLRSSGDVLDGFAGFELLHHEASHLMFGPGWGTVGRALRAASSEAGHRAPRELWHALLFYTSGRGAERIAQAQGQPDYEPYAWANDMWSWAYPGMLQPIAMHWERYLRGEAGMADALREIVLATGDDR